MGIKIHKKFLHWILGAVLLVLAGTSLSQQHSALANTIIGYTPSDLSSALSKEPNGSVFYFTDVHTIKADIKHGGTSHTVSFTFAGTPNDTNTYYPYVSSGGVFCEPNSNYIAPQSGSNNYDASSVLYVKFSDLGKPQAQIAESNPTIGSSSISQLWTGTDNLVKNGKSDCGIDTGQTNSSGNHLYKPYVPVSQSVVQSKNNTPIGVGHQYTLAVVKSATYKLVDSGVIKMTFNTKANGETSIPPPIELVDANPYDTNYQYVSDGLFCNGAGGGRALKFTLTPKDSSLSDSTISADFGSNDQWSYFNGSNCVKNGDNGQSWPSSIKVANGSAGNIKIGTARISQAVAEWDQDSSGNPVIKLVTCDLGGKTCTDGGAPLSPFNSTYIENKSGCQGYTLTLTDNSHGKLQEYTGKSCTLNSSQTRDIIAVMGTKGSTPNPPPTNNPSGTTADCETQAATSNIAGHALAFVACPLLDGAQSFSDYLIGEVENLLSFTFQNNLGNSTQSNQVKNAWSQMRDLASVFLVIIMLVMVLSQAISWGPFDAYTVRKVMPRLVIAVILMQVSWSLLGYVVGLFNDLGHGVADLMYLPFGGSGNLQLGAILKDAGIQAYAGGSVVLVSLIAITAIAVLSLPTILLVGWSIVLALLVAFVTLAVRQILIITLVILAPLAMLLWILPNAQRYWKMWYDNFTKLLLMFPMIIGMIAAGRIFAYITSSGNNNTLIKFMLILIGYFGPFFFVPKAFKWGGQMMQLAGSAVSQTTPKLGGPVTNWLKGEQERSQWTLSRQRRKEQLTRNAQARWAANMTRGPLNPRGYVARARGAGMRSFVPNALGGERGVRRRITYGAESTRDKLRGEEAQEELAHLMSQPRFREQGNWDDIIHMAQNGEDHFRQAAITRMINSRRGDELRHLAANSPHFTEDIRRILAADEAGRVRGAFGDDDMGGILPPGV